MANGVTIDTRQLDAALLEFSSMLKNDPAEVLLDVSRQIAIDAQNATPPFGEGRIRGSSLAAKRQGESAIERSVSNSFTPIAVAETESPFLKSLIEKRDEAGLNKFFEQTGSKWRVAHFSATKHRGNRNAKGRVYRSKKRLSFASADNYTDRAKQRVGTFKAAWGVMAMDLGSHPKAKVKARVPKWVLRNKNRGKAMQKGFHIDVKGPRMRITLGAVSSEYLLFAFDGIVRRRQRTLVKDLQKILQKKTDKLNRKYSAR